MPKTRTETFKRSFIPSTINMWNSLDPSLKTKPLLSSFKKSLRPPKDPMTNIYYYGKRWPSIHHARLRIGCSKLNSHLHYNLHVIPSPNCSCGHHNEDPKHFFFHCPNFMQQRIVLRQAVSPICDFSLKNLLFGLPNRPFADNKSLFDAVHTYICDSNRFSNNS